MGRQASLKQNISPNNVVLFSTKGIGGQGFLLSSVSYMIWSCKVPPNLSFNGEKAAKLAQNLVSFRPMQDHKPSNCHSYI